MGNYKEDPRDFVQINCLLQSTTLFVIITVNRSLTKKTSIEKPSFAHSIPHSLEEVARVFERSVCQKMFLKFNSLRIGNCASVNRKTIGGGKGH